MDAGYLFGQLNQKDILQNLGNGSTLASTTNTVDLNNLYMGYGLQLYGKVGKKWEYVLGGTFNTRADLLSATTRVVLDNDSVQRNIQELSQGYLGIPRAYAWGCPSPTIRNTRSCRL